MSTRAATTMTFGATLSIFGAVTLFALMRPPATVEPTAPTAPTPVLGCERVGSSGATEDVFGRDLPAGVVDGVGGCQRYYDLDWEGPHTFGRPPKRDCG